MGNPFKTLTSSIRFDNARILSWTMEPNANYPEDWTLQMESSRAGGPWQVVAKGLENSCLWVDNRKRNYNKRLDECYRLRLIVPSTGEEWVSPICDAGNHKAYPFSADAENMLKQIEEEVKISGCPGVLIKRKTWGRRCPRCTDFNGQGTVNEHCPRCLGTGIDGGYFPGLSLGVIKDQIQVAEAPSQMGYLQNETVQGRCIAFPWIGYGDVWCEDQTNKRYVIDTATPAGSYKQTTLIYTIKMHLVELTDVLHSCEADNRVIDKDRWLNEDSDAYNSWDDALSVL